MIQLWQIISWAVAIERVPLSWRGGRVANLFKGKGAATLTDNYRGLLISDHASKVLTGALQEEITPKYQRFVGFDQHGGAPGLGTAEASHAVRTFMEVAKMLGLSCAILFLDLTKAFDKAVRELVMGHMQGVPRECEQEVLRSLALPPEAVQRITQVIDEEGTVLQQLGLDKKAAALIKSLHTGAWLQTPGRDAYIVSSTGGRQGCKLGATVFNLAYAVALARVKKTLGPLGVILVVSRNGSKGFWAGGASAQNAAWTSDSQKIQAAHEITYVDDEALLLAAPSPRLLNRAIALLLECLCQTFREFGLIINFAPGKTEIMVQFRGRDAVNAKQVVAERGGYELPSSAGAVLLRAVQTYKHLGSMLSDDCASQADVTRRVNAASAAYAPIAVKVLGRSSFPCTQRLRLATALVFSRLFYNVFVWSSLSSWALTKLNVMYMRVLRRIAGAVRFNADSGMTDLQVRVMLVVPSIECYISRLRLSYLVSLVSSPAHTLKALLAVTVSKNGDRAPCCRS